METPKEPEDSLGNAKKGHLLWMEEIPSPHFDFETMVETNLLVGILRWGIESFQGFFGDAACTT